MKYRLDFAIYKFINAYWYLEIFLKKLIKKSKLCCLLIKNGNNF